MNWTLFDFAVFGAMVGAAALAFALVVRKATNLTHGLAAALAAGSGFFIVWVTLAVGALGEPGDPADLMYLGVLAIGIGGAVIARGRPQGMARAMVAMAAALAGVAAVALLLGKHEAPISSVAEVLGVNAVFAAPCLAAAWLFQRAARGAGPQSLAAQT